jgi:phage shock protein E
MLLSRTLIVGLTGFSLVLASCGGGEPAANAAQPAAAAPDGGSAGTATADITGISVISATDAAAIAESPPENLVVLDIRTPQEFAEGHLEGAVLIDFYDADFAEQLAALDPDVPYLMYCRSGNRSSLARGLMEELGFTAVADVDGGINSWTGAGLPVTGG